MDYITVALTWGLAGLVVGLAIRGMLQDVYYRWKGFEGNVILFPERVIAIRDELVHASNENGSDHVAEAYHQLSEAVAETGDPDYDPYTPWAHIEKEADDAEK